MKRRNSLTQLGKIKRNISTFFNTRVSISFNFFCISSLESLLPKNGFLFLSMRHAHMYTQRCHFPKILRFWPSAGFYLPRYIFAKIHSNETSVARSYSGRFFFYYAQKELFGKKYICFHIITKHSLLYRNSIKISFRSRLH